MILLIISTGALGKIVASRLPNSHLLELFQDHDNPDTVANQGEGHQHVDGSNRDGNPALVRVSLTDGEIILALDNDGAAVAGGNCDERSDELQNRLH